MKSLSLEVRELLVVLIRWVLIEMLLNMRQRTNPILQIVSSLFPRRQHE